MKTPLTPNSRADPNSSRTTSLDVNKLGWVNSITYPNNLSETFAFDAIGNVTNYTDMAGRQTRFTYLPTRKLSSVVRPLSSGAALTNTVAYDEQFNTLNLTDAKGRAVESYRLDIEDRPVSVTNLEGQTMTIAYAIGDDVSQITRFDGTIVTNTYNTDGLLSNVAFPGSTNTFTYLKNGLLKAAANEQGTVSNAWSYANRLTNVLSVVGDLSSVVSYSHFPAGQVSNMTCVVGTNIYSLDAADRLSTLTASRMAVAQQTFSFAYNANNGLISAMTCTNTGITVSNSFDVMDRIADIAYRNSTGGVLRSFAYAYNNASMITNISLEDGSRLAYSYDDLDRLVGESRSGISSQEYAISYGWDEVGNRTVKTNGASVVNCSYSNGCNRLTGWSAAGGAHMPVSGYSSEAIGTNSALGQLYVSNSVSSNAVIPSISGSNFASFACFVGNGTQDIIAAIGDIAGNVGYATNTITVQLVTNAQYGYSAAGCVTSITYSGSGFTNTTTLTWDGQYRLTEVKTNGVSIERNGFDALGRRVWNWNGVRTNYFVYDGNQLIVEVEREGCGIIRSHRSYVWGPGIDNLLAMTYSECVTCVVAAVYYPLKDQQGTIHAMVNTNGIIVESYKYDAWGRVLGVYNGSGQQLTESAIGNRYLWQGREYSWNTGLYCFRTRWYDPITGRWLSNDPIGISGGLNQYVFCANNPVNSVDPLGLDIWIEGPGPSENSWLGLHASICVGDPRGQYTSYSFGAPSFWSAALPWGKGEIYYDDIGGGRIWKDSYLETTCEEDKTAKWILFRMLTEDTKHHQWLYRILYQNCRVFSKQMFLFFRDDLKLGKQETPPVLRSSDPYSSSQSSALHLGLGSSSGTSK